MADEQSTLEAFFYRWPNNIHLDKTDFVELQPQMQRRYFIGDGPNLVAKIFLSGRIIARTFDDVLGHVCDHICCVALDDDPHTAILRVKVPSAEPIRLECNNIPAVGTASDQDPCIEIGAFVRCAAHLVRDDIALRAEGGKATWRIVWALQATQICRCYSGDGVSSHKRKAASVADPPPSKRRQSPLTISSPSDNEQIGEDLFGAVIAKNIRQNKTDEEDWEYMYGEY
uniref:Uncharacterized protein n=1 Tax=Mycena chlorophos TaxID=658473 RepID=A0ABQ0LJC4_MYCCL|nr:predicted protein [Mycena chlorophos]